VYIVKEGLIKNKNKAARMIMAYTGCLRVSMKVFFAIVNNLFIFHYQLAPAALSAKAPRFWFLNKNLIFFAIVTIPE